MTTFSTLQLHSMLNPQTCQQARLSKDARFDGKFFTAVVTTGIFCRPICTARAPKEENVRYFENAEQAQNAGYQPCKRCLPELAPEQSLPVEIKRLTKSLVNEGLTVAELADKFDLSERHVRRLFQKQFSMAPSKYAHHQRLLAARKLITGTSLPVSDICFSAGFTSVRRFNESVKATYGETPTQMRKRSGKITRESEITILLSYRPPFDWQAMLSFFRLRQLPGIEQVTDDKYMRSITLDGSTGWIEVEEVPNKHALKLTLAIEDISLLNQVISRVRAMFDLDAEMPLIHDHLSQDELLARVIRHNPGIRLPGCWDIFEFSIRAILGQQVSVKAATTLAGRIASRYGGELNLTHPSLHQCFPSVEQLHGADYENIGLTQTRIATLKRWVEFFSNNASLFDNYTDLAVLEKTLTDIKGIGPWTVNYLAMRGLSDPNAFPASDLGVIKALSVGDNRLSTKAIIARAEPWQPWRAYATLYLWLSLSQ
ncbi:AlkA N-terminal domain-containing protein [Thalassotalea euphylliae]|uniref:AlkA N-terminal domain-containing protein n=1 Tax=Thalassotalea euphylliae TaxID=1655234 RepID=UPI0036348018